MITTLALVVVGGAQIVFLVGMLTVLFVANRRGKLADEGDLEVTAMLKEPVRALVLGEDQGQSLAAALESLSADMASRQLRLIVASQLGPDQRKYLAALVRPSVWFERALAGGTSRYWWKRMEVARLLNVVMAPSDLPLLARLVQDPDPAVMSAAAGAIAGHADVSLIKVVIRRLSICAPTLRLQQMRALRQHPDVSTGVLISELQTEKSPGQLRALIQLAQILGTPQALSAVVPFHSHPNAGVRTVVARTLRTCFSPEAVDAARVLLQDKDWQVRAAAARAVASLNDRDAIAELRDALNDESWWVRFRSALALGSFGEEGEAALARAAISDDNFARDMAVVVGGLSESARLELSA